MFKNNGTRNTLANSMPQECSTKDALLVLFLRQEQKHLGSGKLEPCRILQSSDTSFNLKVASKAVDSPYSPLTTHFISTKRYCCIKDVIAVDPYCSNSQCPHQGIGSVYIPSINSSSQAIRSCIGPSYHLLQIPMIYFIAQN